MVHPGPSSPAAAARAASREKEEPDGAENLGVPSGFVQGQSAGKPGRTQPGHKTVETDGQGAVVVADGEGEWYVLIRCSARRSPEQFEWLSHDSEVP